MKILMIMVVFFDIELSVDVDNGAKLFVVKWIWTPMAQGACGRDRAETWAARATSEKKNHHNCVGISEKYE